ncbi:hypothetical protein TSA1_29910 [Bradyrhizobium nitroreducens]|uniref:Lecithin:cholesterol acyltransferase n=1 Tax=Bradyrhizobium nitroreducens TaxID=709803 RepID=A0A2M6UIX1_9BRAD|nr:hypothetical protein [Bradyrhizobium nitroreducens]PIT04499.1 hypothetical protein TSA1_29910 [Bradyrhizobium nitroreducens]
MEIVIFVPGIFGSKLKTPDGEEVWPPTPIEAMSGYRRIEKLLQTNLRAAGVVESVCIDVYGSIIKAIEGFGYSETHERRRLAKFDYDWRRDLNLLSDQFGQMLADLVKQHGANVEIKLICHSMGGLVVRGCLEKPGVAAEPWAATVKMAVFLATPHEGAPLAFARAVGVGGATMGLSAEQLSRIAAATGFPACFQLFPSAALLPIWKLDDPSPFKAVSVFDPAVVANYRLNPDHLVAATTFQARLDPTRRQPGCRYFAVASAAHETVTRLDQDHNAAAAVVVKSSGDGTVPIQSATALRVQTAYVEANHLGVAQKSLTHKIIGMLLGAIPVEPVIATFGVEEAALNLSLSERTIAEDSHYEIVITMLPQSELRACIRVQRDIGNAKLEAVTDIPLEARADRLERLSIQGPPLKRGRYVFELLASDDQIADKEELLVSANST